MSGRSERVAAQARDTGSDDDMVYLTGVNGSHYHDDEDCQHLAQSDPQERTRAQAQRRWFEPCSRCVLTERGEI